MYNSDLPTIVDDNTYQNNIILLLWYLESKTNKNLLLKLKLSKLIKMLKTENSIKDII